MPKAKPKANPQLCLKPDARAKRKKSTSSQSGKQTANKRVSAKKNMLEIGNGKRTRLTRTDLHEITKIRRNPNTPNKQQLTLHLYAAQDDASSARNNWRLVKGELVRIPEPTKADLRRLKALSRLPDSAIDLTDIPEITRERLETAICGNPYLHRKEQLTVRLDAQIFEWLKGLGKGYQTKLNAILRAAMKSSQAELLRVTMPAMPVRKKTRKRVELERETDGRWIADIPELPGVVTYGKTKDEALRSAQALALRVFANRHRYRLL